LSQLIGFGAADQWLTDIGEALLSFFYIINQGVKNLFLLFLI
jgi:hypothetical protein